MEIWSPNYPSNYPNRANCTWNIRAPQGRAIKIYFLYFSTESGYDYVQFIDGMDNRIIAR